MEISPQQYLLNRYLPEPGIVLMLCGVAGAGKTTLALQLQKNGFERLSIDEEIWKTYGRYGLDYNPDQYPAFQQNAEAILKQRLITLMQQQLPVVLDYSFWQRSTREAYKALITKHGCLWKLIYLKASKSCLETRLRQRNLRREANAAFPISDALLTEYFTGFEEPTGEGEEIVEVTG